MGWVWSGQVITPVGWIGLGAKNWVGFQKMTNVQHWAGEKNNQLLLNARSTVYLMLQVDRKCTERRDQAKTET